MYNNKLLIRTYTGTYTEIFLNACCTHKNCRFGEVSFLAPVYKSSRISATQRPIRNKFGTNVEKGRLVRNPQIKRKFFVPTYGPFPRGRSHIRCDRTSYGAGGPVMACRNWSHGPNLAADQLLRDRFTEARKNPSIIMVFAKDSSFRN